MKLINLHRIIYKLIVATFCTSVFISCQDNNTDESALNTVKDDIVEVVVEEEDNYKLPNIDLSHWKVTLPVGNPTEIHPPELLNYAKNETLKPFMYNDSTDGSLVFYTYPNASTANSSYSRTELREMIEPGNTKVNWTFEQGGRMKGTLAIDEISKDSEGKYHRVIIMQIHGRLSDDQKDLIGQKDNNAPPILKIYWDKGKIRVKSKILNNKDADDQEILYTDAWGDDKGFNFSKNVDFQNFTLEIIASKGKMEIILNDEESYIIEGEDMLKWGVFENYFKAGNYFVSKDIGSFAKVKYYELKVSH